MSNYRPCPPGTTIAHSERDGFGLFATADIAPGTMLGVGWIECDWTDADEELLFPHGVASVNFGGFVNHDSNANCVRARLGRTWVLRTTRKVRAGEELTLHSELYEPPHPH